MRGLRHLLQVQELSASSLPTQSLCPIASSWILQMSFEWEDPTPAHLSPRPAQGCVAVLVAIASGPTSLAASPVRLGPLPPLPGPPLPASTRSSESGGGLWGQPWRRAPCPTLLPDCPFLGFEEYHQFIRALHSSIPCSACWPRPPGPSLAQRELGRPRASQAAGPEASWRDCHDGAGQVHG